MATCVQTLNGLLLDCSGSLGGIKKVWIANYKDVDTANISADTIDDTTTDESGNTSADTTYGMIVQIPMVGNAKFKPYEFRKNTGTMTSTLNIDEASGSRYVSTELSLVFTKQETAKRLEIAALAVGQLAVIVLDSNNKYWYLGIDDYVGASAGSANSGTAKSDSNNYSISLSTESDTFPYEILPSAVKEVTE